MLTLSTRLRILAGPEERSSEETYTEFTDETFTGWPQGDLTDAVFVNCTFFKLKQGYNEWPVPSAPRATFENCIFDGVRVWDAIGREGVAADWTDTRFVGCTFKASAHYPGLGGGVLSPNLKGAHFDKCTWEPGFVLPVDQTVFLHDCRISPVPEKVPSGLDAKHGRYQMALDGRIVLHQHVQEKGSRLKFHDGSALLMSLMKRKRAEKPRDGVPRLHNLVFDSLDLHGQSFHGLNITNCLFSRCNLARVTSFDPYQCRFYECDLSGTWSGRANEPKRLGHSSYELRASNADSTEFGGCTFRGNVFNGTSLGGVTWNDCTFVDVGFQYAQLQGAVFKSGSYHNVTFLGSLVADIKALQGALDGGPAKADLTGARLGKRTSPTEEQKKEAFAGLLHINAGRHRWVYDEDGTIELE